MIDDTNDEDPDIQLLTDHAKNNSTNLDDSESDPDIRLLLDHAKNAPTKIESAVSAMDKMDQQNIANQESSGKGALEGLREVMASGQNLFGGTTLGGLLPTPEENKLARDQYNAQYGKNVHSDIGRLAGQTMATLPLMEAGGSLLGAATEAAGSIPILGRAANFLSGKGGTISKATNVVGKGYGQGAASTALTSSSSDVPLSEQIQEGGGEGALFNTALHSIPAVGKYIGNLSKNDNDFAIGKVLQNLKRDNLSLDDVKTKLDQAGPNATIADVAGKNTLGLGDTLGNVPGEAQDKISSFLNQRHEGQQNRLLSAANQGLGVDPSVSYEDNVNNLIAQRKEAASPLYKEAHAQSIPTSVFSQLVQNPIIAKAINNVKNKVEYRAAIPEINFGSETNPSTSRKIPVSPAITETMHDPILSDTAGGTNKLTNSIPNSPAITENVAVNPYTSDTKQQVISPQSGGYSVSNGGTTSPTPVKIISPETGGYSVSTGGGGKLNYGYNSFDPVMGNKLIIPEANVHVLDVAKQNIDDQIKAAEQAGKYGKAGYLRDAKGQLTSTVDEHVPVYGQARKAYENPSQSLNAIQQGADFIKSGGVQNATDLAKLSDQDKQFFRIGAGKTIGDMLNSTPESADAVKKLLGNQDKKNALQSVFPTKEAYDNFKNVADTEKGFFQTRAKINGGSPTAPRLASMQDAEQPSLISPSDVYNAATGNKMAAAANVYNKGRNMLTQLNPQRASSAANLLFNTDHDAVMKILQEYANRAPNKYSSGANKLLNTFGVPAATLGINNYSQFNKTGLNAGN